MILHYRYDYFNVAQNVCVQYGFIRGLVTLTASFTSIYFRDFIKDVKIVELKVNLIQSLISIHSLFVDIPKLVDNRVSIIYAMLAPNQLDLIKLTYLV